MEDIFRFFKDDTGATAAEYSIMAALIAGVIITTVVVFGEQVKALFDLCLEVMTNNGI
jgi:Flp pilus assembly pilin Flp